jgi:hypothetical protein
VVLPQPAPRAFSARALLGASLSLGALLVLTRAAVGGVAARGAMDHGGMHGDDTGGGMAMQMTFYWGTRVTLWFDGWATNDAGEYVLALAGLAALCVAQEALLVWRARAALPVAGDAGRCDAASALGRRSCASALHEAAPRQPPPCTRLLPAEACRPRAPAPGAPGARCSPQRCTPRTCCAATSSCWPS